MQGQDQDLWSAADESIGSPEGEQARKQRNRRRGGKRTDSGKSEGGKPQADARIPRADSTAKERRDRRENPSRGEGHARERQNARDGKFRGKSSGKQQRPARDDVPPNSEHRGYSEHAKKRRGSGYGSMAKRGLEDLYGTPTEEDVLTLEELRARIVLKSADGSVPAETAAPATEASAQKADPAPMDVPDGLLMPMPEDPPEATDPSAEQTEVVGIRFRSAGKVYYFDPKGIQLRYRDAAVVETARGPEFGEVTFGNRMINKKDTVSPLRPVLRAATEEDIAHNEENRAREKEALVICNEKIQAHKLEMKLVDAQYAFDNSQLLFYFTADGRVDFRALVKDLASIFRTRIELRQIGIRDEAKMLGGLGACGRPLCCATFLPDVVQVSIKMAKEQNLSLNSAKISGVCGRLMCCLRYEAEVYAEEARRTPPHGATVQTADGIGTVISTSPLAGTVRVAFKNAPDTPPQQYARDEVTVLSKRGKETKENTDQND